MRLVKVWCVSMVLCGGLAAHGQSGADAAVSTLVDKFLAAEKAYDSAALATLIDPKYVEVSPAGEVDEHDRFLGFYTADKKADWPPMAVGEKQIRVIGDTALEIVKISYTMPGPNGATRAMDIRGTFAAHKQGGNWKLVGAQFTGIRPVPAAK